MDNQLVNRNLHAFGMKCPPEDREVNPACHRAEKQMEVSLVNLRDNSCQGLPKASKGQVALSEKKTKRAFSYCGFLFWKTPIFWHTVFGTLTSHVAFKE